MKFEVNVIHRHAIARFTITREAAGIFTADLVQFNGNFQSTIPKKITLTKGVRGWAGSIRDKELLDKLGSKIEEY